MKRIKVFLALLFSLACMFSLVACGGNYGRYVEDSFDGNIKYYSSLKDVSATVEFQVFLPDAATYEISYTLKMYYLSSLIGSEDFTTTYKSKGSDTADISKYWSIDYSASGVSESYFEVEITNIIAKPKFSGLSEHSGLAIGFGIVGGLITVGLIVLYVCLKKNGDKAQAA
ncbi:MAG: hypothetical protein K2F90_06570 [Clostridiales bacterium]|nr:hypothetical protein [Clostridiales bacterium]